jgi:hypothetical protein
MTSDREAQDRQAFEAAIGRSPYEKRCLRFPDTAATAWPGNYRDIEVDLAWCMWQAALSHERARLLAVLPAAGTVDAVMLRKVVGGAE